MGWLDSAISGVAGIGSSLIGASSAGKSSAADRDLSYAQLAEQKREFDKQIEIQGKELGLTRDQIEAQKAQFAARQKAYGGAIGAGRQMAGAGEKAFTREANTALPELAQLKADIQNQTAAGLQEASGQMGAELAKQGVRGGQAATQMARGVGQMGITANQNINQLIADEARQRQAQRMAFQSAKAQQGQAAQTAMPAF
jgi:hypothetical protein